MRRVPQLRDRPRRYVAAGRTACLAFASLVRMRWTLDRRGFAAAMASANRLAQRPRPNCLKASSTAEIVHRLADLAPARLNCLPRALTLWSLTRSAGHATELKIGVAPRRIEGQRLDAHAWVELDGIPLGENAARYVHLPFDEPRVSGQSRTGSGTPSAMRKASQC